MPKVRSNFAEKWARVTPQRTQDYTQGVQDPRRSWEQATEAAKQNWQDGVQKAAQNDQFSKGVRKAGEGKWQRKSIEVGATRFAQGVQAAQSDYEQGFAPFAQVIENTNLPPRFPKGDPRNLERVKAINTALRNKKVQG